MKVRWKLFFALLAAPFQGFAVGGGYPLEEKVEPWLTGPLLSPYAWAIPLGSYDIEPYVYVFAEQGSYDADWKIVKAETVWRTLVQPAFYFGITPWMDFEFNPGVYYNYSDGAAQWVAADMPLGFNIQLYQKTPETVTNWDWAVKLSLRETVPLGKYQHLDPKKKSTDFGGQGSWQTLFGLVWGNIFHLGGVYFLNTIVSVEYTLPAPVHVKGLNAYGGGAGTSGTVYPAHVVYSDVAFELALSRNWVFAMDVVGSWSSRTRFKGKTVEVNTLDTAVQYSLAPAIEYNWGPSLGLIAGAWFTIAGRNTTYFNSGVIALNYYH